MSDASLIRRGTPAYRRASFSLLLAGLGTFNLLYAVQPLMPVFSREFGVGADETALLLSLTTCVLAPSLLIAAPIADRFGRKPVMAASICTASLLTIASGTVTDWHVLLVLRALLGVALAGVPAVAMTYLAEEIAPDALNGAMGFYIGGNAMGGVIGRLLNGFLADVSSWHYALVVSGTLGLAASMAMIYALPRSRAFVPHRHGGVVVPGLYRNHLRRPFILLMLLEGAILSGAFVTTFNLVGYRLNGPPFNLSIGITSLVFVVYLLGSPTTILVGQRLGHVHPTTRIIAGIALMLAGLACMWLEAIAPIALGIALLTIGFFTAHSSASGWIAIDQGQGRAQAASLYLFSFYAGSGALSWVGGHLWSALAWHGVTFFLVGLLALGSASAVAARRAQG